MKVGFHAIAPGVRLSFDDEKKTIHVIEYQTPIPGFYGNWVEVATFTSEEDWFKSRFSEMIIDTYYKEMILWFWIDAYQTASNTLA